MAKSKSKQTTSQVTGRRMTTRASTRNKASSATQNTETTTSKVQDKKSSSRKAQEVQASHASPEAGPSSTGANAANKKGKNPKHQGARPVMEDNDSLASSRNTGKQENLRFRLPPRKKSTAIEEDLSEEFLITDQDVPVSGGEEPLNLTKAESELLTRGRFRPQQIQDFVINKNKKMGKKTTVYREDLPYISRLKALQSELVDTTDTSPDRTTAIVEENQEPFPEGSQAQMVSDLEPQDLTESEHFKNLVLDHERRLAYVPSSEEFSYFEQRMKGIESMTEKMISNWRNLHHITLDYITEGRNKEIQLLRHENKVLTEQRDSLLSRLAEIQKLVAKYEQQKEAPESDILRRDEESHIQKKSGRRTIRPRALEEPIRYLQMVHRRPVPVLVRDTTRQDSNPTAGPSRLQENGACAETISDGLPTYIPPIQCTETGTRSEQDPSRSTVRDIGALLNPAPASSVPKRKCDIDEHDAGRHSPRRRTEEDS